MKAILALCLLVSACAPARLVKLPADSHTTSSTDLARALDGAQDPAAKRSLGNWIARNFKTNPPPSPTGYSVRFAEKGPGVFSPSYFDSLEPVSRYRVSGLKTHASEGAGVPLAGIRENRHLAPVEKWYPPEAITRPVTAVAISGSRRNGLRQIEIRLLDRMRSETIGKSDTTLAGDFTTPFTALLERAGPLKNSGITTLMRGETHRKPGFFLMEPYDPQRTPLILIHGLISTPLAWADLTNELWAVPEIRKRYQIWHYYYPTNPPALYSARVMRGKLDELRHFLDPRGNDPAMRRTVIISHSMGGLLAKTLAVDPKDAFWDAVFTRPLDSLNVTPAERATLEEAFYWRSRGNVDRIIFCSVPFQGSNVANSWIGRMGNLLAAPSPEFQDFFREVERKNPGMLQPDYTTLTTGKISSVGALAPRQRSMEILDQLPLTGGTASHVITGSKDFVVQRSSASIKGAESNIEVPAGHGSFHHPEAIEEIIRILKLPPAH